MTKTSNRKTAPVKTPKSAPDARDSKVQAKQEKEPFSIGRGTTITLALVTTLAVIALSIFHLIVRNSDMLFMAQSKSFFSSNGVFLHECMHQPGGFIAYLASYLTQHFYHPALGATLMTTLWVASLWVSKFAFRVRTAWAAVLALPVVCLLVGVIGTGYWLYYIKQTGYWFYGTVGYFIAMLLVLFYGFFRKRSDRIIVMLLIAITYPFIGWYALLALLYAAALTLATPLAEEEKPSTRIAPPIVAAVLVAAVPFVSYYLYSAMRLEDMWTAGFPYFTNDDLVSFTPELPYIVMAILPLGFAFIPKQAELKGKAAWGVFAVTLAVLAFSCLWTEKADFQNYNYHAEMRMYRAAEEQDWEAVLDEMGSIPDDASREMVLLKNIALLNTGELGEKMFRYNNMGKRPANDFDTLHVHMVQTAAPLIYYYHGKTNFATRWCIENNVEFGTNFDNIKMLARCALVGGEWDLARKYLQILQASAYHKEWADNLMPITDKPELLATHHEFDTVRELRDHMGTVLDGDNGLCEMYLLNYFSNTINKDSELLEEATLNYALVQKDIQLFWPRFFLYAQMHPDQKMPTHYQEAAYLYGNLEPDNVDISGMPFDQTIKERYQGFQQLSQSLLASGLKAPEVGEAMKSAYGDTFYWFYFFCRDVHSY